MQKLVVLTHAAESDLKRNVLMGPNSRTEVLYANKAFHADTTSRWCHLYLRFFFSRTTSGLGPGEGASPSLGTKVGQVNVKLQRFII